LKRFGADWKSVWTSKMIPRINQFSTEKGTRESMHVIVTSRGCYSKCCVARRHC
jgi:hypothetical protein